MQPPHEVPTVYGVDPNPPSLRTMGILLWLHAAFMGLCGSTLAIVYGSFLPTLVREELQTGRNSAMTSAQLAGMEQQFGVAAVFFGVGSIVFVALNIASALLIKQRRLHALNIGIAALNLLAIPIGTALGIYSLSQLTKPEIKSLFTS